MLYESDQPMISVQSMFTWTPTPDPLQPTRHFIKHLFHTNNHHCRHRRQSLTLRFKYGWREKKPSVNGIVVTKVGCRFAGVCATEAKLQSFDEEGASCVQIDE